MIAAALGYDVHDKALRISEETPSPLIMKTHCRTSLIHVQPHEVCGIHQKAVAIVSGKPVISHDFIACLGVHEPRDEIKIYATTTTRKPSIHMEMLQGTFNDTATISLVVNCIPFMLQTTPGLKTMLDVPVRYWPKP
jgi:4-hydroxy-tetrahydrodipicolinate reductase